MFMRIVMLFLLEPQVPERVCMCVCVQVWKCLCGLINICEFMCQFVCGCMCMCCRNECKADGGNG